ncbi:MAG: DUF3995 domain-containing protein [Paracoccaceae bacterium]
MMVLQASLTGVLALLMALHVAWGIGLWLPIRDEAALARAVVGAPGRNRMPGAVACSLVAVALFAAASVLWWSDSTRRDLALAGAAAVFLVRGLAAWLPAWRRLLPVEPFATLDRRAYGPLCLAIGAGFLAVLLA